MDEMYAWIKEMIDLRAASGPGDTDYTPEDAPEMPEGTPEDYRAGMQRYLEEAGLTDEQIEEVLDQLEAEGDYTEDGYEQNIIFVIENNEETINNHVDNSITLEEGAEVHDIHQANDTNQSNATGDDAIAGRDQDGQFQSGDGVQSGDGNTGTVFQGENEGQVAGGNAEAGDITGDGGINVGGNVSNSGFGTGEGDVAVAVDQSYDNSTHDSGNQTDVGNTDWSGNTTDSGNYSSTETSENSYTAGANVEVSDSFQLEVEEAGYGRGHDGEEGGELLEEIGRLEELKRLEDTDVEELGGYEAEPKEYEVPQLPEPEGHDYERETYEPEPDPHCEPEEEPAEYLAES